MARRLYDEVATYEGYVVYTLPVGDGVRRWWERRRAVRG